jgi:hypothetical protein
MLALYGELGYGSIRVLLFSDYETALTPVWFAMLAYPLVLGIEFVSLVWFVSPWPQAETAWRHLFAWSFSFAFVIAWLCEIAWLFAVVNDVVWIGLIATFVEAIVLVTAWYVSTELLEGDSTSSSNGTGDGGGRATAAAPTNAIDAIDGVFVPLVLIRSAAYVKRFGSVSSSARRNPILDRQQQLSSNAPTTNNASASSATPAASTAAVLTTTTTTTTSTTASPNSPTTSINHSAVSNVPSIYYGHDGRPSNRLRRRIWMFGRVPLAAHCAVTLYRMILTMLIVAVAENALFPSLLLYKTFVVGILIIYTALISWLSLWKIDIVNDNNNNNNRNARKPISNMLLC